jgi:hypothetical protein
MSHSVLISTFLSLAKPAFQRVALSADADAGGDDAIVRADDASAGAGGRLKREPNRSAPAATPAAAAPTRVANSRRVMPSGSLSLVSHSPSSVSSQGYGRRGPLGVRFLRQGDWYDQ